MNIWKKIKQQKLQKYKEQMKPIDAVPLIKFMMETRESATKEERKAFLTALEKGFQEAGKTFVERAIFENVITESEWKDMQTQGFRFADMSTILQAYFNVKDEHVKTEDHVMCVTMPDSIIYKHRDFLKKRFNVDIITPEEGLKIMKKEHDKN